MKKISLMVLPVLVAALCVAFAACGGEGESISLTASNTVYSHGEQTVELSFSPTAGGYVFEDDISVSDVTVGEGLEGKEVTAVEYVNDSTVNVTISGTVTGTVENDGLLGSIIVDGGISDNAVGTAYVTIYTPQMMVTSVSSSNIGDLHNFSSTYTLPYGSFVAENVNTEHIELPDTNGTLSVSLTEDGNLYVRVTNFTPTETDANPVIHIAADVTTFNKELYAFVGVPTPGVGSGYDLV